MIFPRNPVDNTLDLRAFSALSPVQQKEAFADLKTNGTLEERSQFQAHLANIRQKKAELAQSKERVAELEKQMEALKVKEAGVLNNLKSHTSALVGAQFNHQTAATSKTAQCPIPAIQKNSLKI